MSDKTQPPTREATPAPAGQAAQPSDDTVDSASPSGAGATSAPPAEADGAAPAAAGTAPISQRLYTGNFEEEVGQVMKGLGSFWGGFKTRSALTLTTLKADLDKTVAQVQTDLRHLQETKVEVQTKDQATWEKEKAEEKERARMRDEEEKARKEAEQAENAALDKGKGKARAVDGEDSAASETAAATGPQATATALLNRLTSSTTQLQSSIQSTLASTLAAAKANPALANPAQLRSQLAENLRLQTARENITLSLHQAEKLAEEYLKKGEGYLKEAERVGGNLMKDAEKWVEENVKVVPPQDGQFIAPSTGWDGDWYSFSTVSVPDSPAAEPAVGSSSAPRSSLSSAAVAGSRKEALLRRLREDKDLLMVDPASEAETKERRDEFAAWVATKWPDAKTAGREAEEGNVGGIRMALVPELLTDEQFWQRYLFHKDMIEAADAKRKELLQASQEEADDFSWDDDEDEQPAPKAGTGAGAGAGSGSGSGAGTSDVTPTASVSASTADAKADAGAGTGTAGAVPVPVKAGVPAPAAAGKDAAGAATSPRDSEESYDVVSRQASTAAQTEDDDDSDWE